MRLHERLPDRLRVDGRAYRVNLDFRNILRVFDVLSDQTLMPEARQWLALRCVMRHPPRRRLAAAYTALLALISDGARHGDGNRVMSFDQDADLILAAFRQNYGIDLYRDRMHWLEFRALLAGLPEGSRFAEVITIRAREIPAATKYNGAEIAGLLKAKAAVALEMTDEEREAGFARSLRETTLGLMAWAKRGDDSG